MLTELEIKLIEIVKKGTSYGVFFQTNNYYQSQSGLISFRAHGFSKSGVVELYIENDKIIAEARYEEKSEIETFDDLAYIALDWYSRYRTTFGFEKPDPYWLRVFKEKGWISYNSSEIITIEINDEQRGLDV